MLTSARAYKERHPGLYEKYIRENQNKLSYENLLLVGKEALERIVPKYLVRSRIALLLANMVIRKSGKVTTEVEQYWMETFRSNSRTVHFLGMMMECRDFYKWQKKLQEINHGFLIKNKNGNSYAYDRASDLRENEPNLENIYLTAILNGEYKFIKEQGMNYKGALGWSASYMKNGLSAFLLLLLNSELLLQGGREMFCPIETAASIV